MSKVIGLSGFAGSGKDMFYERLSKKIPNLKRFALADLLKEEIFHTLYELYKINIFSCSRESKEIVRPMLVAHGLIRRKYSDGTYWTKRLQKQIELYFSENPDGVACVTDIRYAVYHRDELYWIKNVMKGKLIHISQHTVIENPINTGLNPIKVYLTPPNIEEQENDPKIQSESDYLIDWPRLINKDDLTPDWSRLDNYVTKCIEHIGM